MPTLRRTPTPHCSLKVLIDVVPPDAFGGILSNSTDNSVRGQPTFGHKKWNVVKHTSVTLGDILDHANAPKTIDYLSLDIEGAEYDALSTFDFGKYTFLSMSIERPTSKLRALLPHRRRLLWEPESRVPKGRRTRP